MGTVLESRHPDRRRPPGIPGQPAGAGRPGAARDRPSQRSPATSSSATATAAGLPALLRRPPPRTEVRKTIQESREEDAAPSRRPGARAQVSLRRGLAQVRPRGADTRARRQRGRPGPCAARRPALTSARRLLGGRAAASPIASAGAALPEPGPAHPAPRRPRSPRPTSRRPSARSTRAAAAPASHSHRAAGAAPATARPHTAHACPRRLSPQTAAEIPKPALPARGDYKSRQAPRGSRRRGGPGFGRLPNSRGGGLGASGRAARGALVRSAAVPPGIGSFRGAGAWLGVGGAETRGSLMSSPRASRHGDL